MLMNLSNVSKAVKSNSCRILEDPDGKGFEAFGNTYKEIEKFSFKISWSFKIIYKGKKRWKL